MIRPPLGRDTKLCMSLSARPGNFGTRFHNRLYELTGLDYVYKAFSTTDLEGAVRGIRALGIRGSAVSMPFKEAVIPLIDRLESSAMAIDSVNTIVNDDGTLTGHNTDYRAVASLLVTHAVDPSMPFLLRGSGGMAKAVVAALRDAGFTHGTVVARSEARGRALAERYGFAWAAEPDTLSAPLLVNVTPLGMEGPDVSSLSFTSEQIAAAEIVFDVVTLPVVTELLDAAKNAGKRVITGAQVMVLQAVEQFVLYTGVQPTSEQIEDAEALALRAVSR